MTKIELTTFIKGQASDAFELSLNIDFHMESVKNTNEKAISGVTSGQISLGQSVTFRGKHFGLFLTHTSKIVQMVKNQSFTDVMTKGHFTYFVHQHLFEQNDGIVKMTDILKYKVPYGFLGKILDSLFIKSHIHNFLEERNQQIKNHLEKC